MLQEVYQDDSTFPDNISSNVKSLTLFVNSNITNWPEIT